MNARTRFNTEKTELTDLGLHAKGGGPEPVPLKAH
jgi:hypothetical protein